MSRKYALGTVAMLSGMDREEDRQYLGVKAGGGDGWRVFDAADPKFTVWDRPPVVRSVVVIDPEDEAQVQRLHDLFEAKWLAEHPRAHSAYSCNSGTCRTDVFQAALREFANPTPPVEEPAGYGAVVRVRFAGVGAEIDALAVRTGRDGQDGENWYFTHPLGGGWRSWDRLDVIEVLSEGYTPEVES